MNNLCNAIIFNPNQELELIKKQKEIIKSFARENQKAFPKFPVFCFLKSPEWNGLSLKEIKSIIKKVSFEEVYLKDFSICKKIKILITDNGKTASIIEEAVQIASLKANDSQCYENFGIEKLNFDDHPTKKSVQSDILSNKSLLQPTAYSYCNKNSVEGSLSSNQEEVCKIFKLAQVECSKYSWTINEYIWCKL